MFDNIIVCLDGSELAEQILPYAVEEAVKFNSKLVLLHVIPDPLMITPGIPGAEGGPVVTSGMVEHMQNEREETAEYLQQKAQLLRGQGLKVETILLQGSPGKTIVVYSNENNIDLIAIATHGRSGLGRVVFGSVADHILRHSGLPILIINPRES